MRETLERRKSEKLIVLQCEQCGHHEQTLTYELKACPVCEGVMSEAPELEDEDEERR